MGVDRTDYLMLGVDLGPDAFDWDKHIAELEGRPDRRFDLVDDSMCGKYCIAGKIIAVSEPYEGIGMTKINPDDLGIDKEELAAKVSAAFDRPIKPDDFALMLFSHFS